MSRQDKILFLILFVLFNSLIWIFWIQKGRVYVKMCVDEIIVDEYQKPITEMLDTLIILYDEREYRD